jgi:hypothetical protein
MVLSASKRSFGHIRELVPNPMVKRWDLRLAQFGPFELVAAAPAVALGPLFPKGSLSTRGYGLHYVSWPDEY